MTSLGSSSNTEGNTRRFKVAGHSFTLKVEAGNGIWSKLLNYSPFETSEAGKDIFSLGVSFDGSVSLPEGLRPVFKKETAAEEPLLNLYQKGEEWWAEMAPFGNMPPVAFLSMSEDFTEASLVVKEGKFGKFAIDNAMMLLFAFNTSDKSTIEMHASVIMKDGKGFLFLGSSGTGKSTQSRMWLESVPGSELLNDDNPAVRVSENGEIRVFGTPWSGKTPCYRNLDVQVGAIVKIRRCRENRITPLSLPEAYAEISSSTSSLKSVRRMADGLHSTLAAIATTVPCYVLDCLPDHDSAQVCSKEVCR